MPASIFRTDRLSPVVRRGLGWYRVALAGLIIFSCAHPLRVSAEGFGPFPVRNFNPLQQLVLNMPGDRAAVLRKGTLDVRLELAETAAIYREESPQAAATVKFETLRSGLFLRYGATEKLEVALEIPALYRYHGFMEGPIKAVERATTGLAPARNALAQTGYAYDISRGGQQVVHGKKGAVGLGDTTLMTKYQLLSETSSLPTLSVRAAVKLPTGDEGDLFGSGSPDFGIGLAAEKSLGGRWILYGNVNGVFPTGRIAGMPLQPTLSGLAALEYLWSENLSMTLQFDYYSTPFHGVGLRVLDKGVTEVVAGVNYRMTRHWLWQVYGVENVDFITGSAADFTLATLFTYRFES
ncbi:MAG TPA: DUF3187 family protein [Nitrospira sp.]|nr:DUF3187 family protein [Nitrospira sp.]